MPETRPRASKSNTAVGGGVAGLSGATLGQLFAGVPLDSLSWKAILGTMVTTALLPAIGSAVRDWKANLKENGEWKPSVTGWERFAANVLDGLL